MYLSNKSTWFKMYLSKKVQSKKYKIIFKWQKNKPQNYHPVKSSVTILDFNIDTLFQWFSTDFDPGTTILTKSNLGSRGPPLLCGMGLP